MNTSIDHVSKIHILSIHPKFVEAYCSFGVIAAFKEKGLGSVNIINLRNFAVDQRGSVDDRPFGGGDSMVMCIEPLVKALRTIPEKPRVILTSPKGRVFKQADAIKFAQSTQALLFVCGRFAGVDQRFIDHYVDEEISVGDFVVSGGELPALLMIDAALRLVPGVLGNQESSVADTFSETFSGGLEYPVYTRPQIFEGLKVPDILLSGHQEKIRTWQNQQADALTAKLRPDLIKPRRT